MSASVIRSDLLLGLSCLLPVASLAASDFHPFDGPRPIAIFLQAEPGGAVLGADDPRVAIYEDGQVIYVTTVEGQLTYRTFTLDTAGLAKVRNAIAPVLDLEDLRPHYDVSGGTTDQPEARFYLSDGEREAATTVYGLAAGETLPAAAGASAGCPPREVRELHAWFSKLDDEHSVEWEPQYVEVSLWQAWGSAGQQIAWPSDWPSLESERAVKHSDGWSIFLDGSQLPRLRALLATRQPSAAIEIAGRKMAVSWHRAFPGELVWREALDRSAAASSAVASAQPQLPVDLNLLPPMEPIMDVRPEELVQLIDRADRLVVRDWSEETGRRDKVLYESKQRADLDALKPAVKLRVPEGWTHCMCLGSVEVSLYAGETSLGSFTNQHAWGIRCSLWHSDVELADPESFLNWFDERKITGPREEHDEMLQGEKTAEAARQTWLSAMPRPLVPLWTESAWGLSGPEDLSGFRDALETQIADRNERVLALLAWYGSGAGPWSGYPSYEDVAQQLLLDYTTPVLNAIGCTKELNPAQLEGLARLLGGWTFSQRRPDDRVLVSPVLKARLLEHVRKSGDQYKLGWAEHSFGSD